MSLIDTSHSWLQFRTRFESVLGEYVDTGHVEPRYAALMFMLAREVPDDSELFPRGKWAMIQHLEAQLVEHFTTLPSAGTGDK